MLKNKTFKIVSSLHHTETFCLHIHHYSFFNWNVSSTSSSFKYNEFISALERLVEHPFSYRVKDFLFRFRIPISSLQSMDTFVAPELDEEGKAFVEAIGRLQIVNKVNNIWGGGYFKETLLEREDFKINFFNIF